VDDEPIEPTDHLTSVLSTEPFVLDQPTMRIRRAKIALLLFALAIIVCSAGAAYVGYELGATRTNNQIAALNKARAVSHANLLAGQKANTAQNERTRELVCDLLQRMPTDPQINADRIANHCGPYLPPKSRPTITATTTSTTVPNPQPNPAPTVGRPKPKPTPTPTPGPPQTPTLSPTPPQLLCILGICM
jgi:hypothetical protein